MIVVTFYPRKAKEAQILEQYAEGDQAVPASKE